MLLMLLLNLFFFSDFANAQGVSYLGECNFLLSYGFGPPIPLVTGVLYYGNDHFSLNGEGWYGSAVIRGDKIDVSLTSTFTDDEFPQPNSKTYVSFIHMAISSTTAYGYYRKMTHVWSGTTELAEPYIEDGGVSVSCY